MLLLIYQWSNLDKTWVVASYHLPDVAAMMRFAMVTAVA